MSNRSSPLARLLATSIITLCGAGLSSGCAPDDATETEAASPIIGGTTVSVATQRALGLVTIGPFGCSGTLITRDWALTATHCIASFPIPGNTTVKSVKPDGTLETRQAIALEQVGAADMTLIQLAASTATATWPNVTHTMYGADPSNVRMACYGLGDSAYKLPSGTTGAGTWRTAVLSGPVINGEIFPPSPTGTPSAAPGDSGGPCFIGNQIAGVCEGGDYDCADHTTAATCKATITKITSSRYRATNDFSVYIDNAPLRPQTATFQQLGNLPKNGVISDLLNGWTSHPFGTNLAGLSVVQNVAHLRGAIATGGNNTNSVPFKVAAPFFDVYVPINLCNASKGRLHIAADGTVDVQVAGGDFSQAQCFTSLDGATFAVNVNGTTPLTLVNNWSNGPYGTRPAAARVVNGVVQFQGAIAGGNSVTPFQLPAQFRPTGRTVYVPVDLCNAAKGRLMIDISGNVTINAFGSFSDAQCFTSLEGVSYQIGGGALSLPLASGWTFSDPGYHTSSPSVKNDEGIIRFAGTMRATGTSDLVFTLPSQFWPATDVYVPVDLCGSEKGRLLIQKNGSVHVQVSPGATWAAAQCFVSLEGASYGL